MSEEMMTRKVRHKRSVAIEAGYKCCHCHIETITFDGSVPVACLECGHENLTLVWKDKITNHTKVETL